MSTNEILSLGDLNTAVADAAETLLLSDLLLDKIIDWLNRKKLQRVADKIDVLNEYCKRFEQDENTIKIQIELIEEKIVEIQEDKKFRLTDILTLGLSFAGRRAFTSIREKVLESTKERCEIKIIQMRKRSEFMKVKVQILEKQLEILEKQRYPSILAKILKFLQIIKHIIFAFINVLSGRLIKSLTELFGLYKTVNSLEDHRPKNLIEYDDDNS